MGIRSGLSVILTGSEILLGIPIVICYVKFLEQLLLLLEFMAGGENDDQAGVSNNSLMVGSKCSVNGSFAQPKYLHL